MTNKPKISIVTVSFNAVKQIENTITSVLNQTYPYIEYIIIDGGSTDGSVDIIKRYAHRLTYWISEPDEGIYDGMNKGLQVASGEWINFMNSGDTFFNTQVIENTIKLANEKSDIIFGSNSVIKDNILYEVIPKPFYKNLPLHHDMGFNHQCTFVRTSLAKKYKFDTKFKLAADYNMVITLYRNKAIFQQINLIIAKYDLTGVSTKYKKTHDFETLCIDRPSKLKLNRLTAEILSTQRAFYLVIKKVICYFYPKAVLIKRAHNSRFKIIKNYDS